MMNWNDEAIMAAKRTKAFSPRQVVQLMERDTVSVVDMDEWCAQLCEDWPCLFMANLNERVVR